MGDSLRFARVYRDPACGSLIALLALAGCLATKIRQDPFYESFFEKVQLIMTSEEIRIYKSLPDERSKAEFIEEFWKIRDPDPGTEENEARVEFEERVRYANLWFGSFNPHRGRDTGEDYQGRTGWSEDRGRIYIILGPPDILWYFDERGEYPRFDGTRDFIRSEDWIAEQWIYERYNCYVNFVRDRGGSWHMQTPDARLFDILEWAKLNWISTDLKEEIGRRFRFEARFVQGGIAIRTPLSRVSFDSAFRAEFAVRIDVYRDNVRVDEIRLPVTIEESEENLTSGRVKRLEFTIPYVVSEPGRYLFDIVVEDRLAPVMSKHRAFLKRRF